MKRQITFLFVVTGILNFVAMYGAITVVYGLYTTFDSVQWIPVVIAFSFFATGILLCRAPFSRRRVDYLAVTILRIALIGGCVSGFWTVQSVMIRDGMDALCLVLSALALLNMYLILSMKSLREHSRVHHM